MVGIVEGVVRPLANYVKHAVLAEVDHVRSGVSSVFRDETKINEKALDGMVDHIIEASLNRALLKIEFMSKSNKLSVDYSVGPLIVFRPGRKLGANEQEQLKIEELVSSRPVYSLVLQTLKGKGLGIQDIKHDVGSVEAGAPMSTVFTLTPNA